MQNEQNTQAPVSEVMVHHTLELARRLKEQNGGVLDDSAIMAVSEALGMPEEYVRTVAVLDVQQGRVGFARKMRGAFQSLRPETRRVVTAGLLASLCGLAAALASLSAFVADKSHSLPDFSSLFGVGKILFMCLAVYNMAVSKDLRSALLAGGLFGAFSFAVYGVIVTIFRVGHINIDWMVLTGVLGAVMGAGVFLLIDRYRKQLGIKDAVKERQDLLRQLVDIQSKLRAGEQTITFMSVDIVGSTKMKEQADPLSVEYTFGEYHQFVDFVTTRYGGRVHSTAGDGVTCAFDTPQQAFAAGRNLQTGLIELNTHRNRIGQPIRLRVGVHSGKVVAPDADDITTVNFAHVIDVAAHVQKVCPTGGVAVSAASVAGLTGGARMVGEQTIEIDGVVAHVWQPKSGIAVPTAATPQLPQ